MQSRQIDITKQDVRCCDGLMEENGKLNATYELWFDSDKYFGIEKNDNDDIWTDFYTDWNPENDDITAYLVAQTDDGILSEGEWALTEIEKAFFRGLMQAYAWETEHCSLKKVWEKITQE